MIKLHILDDAMMRTATTLIMVFSYLSTPIASAVCMDCCNRSVEHRLPLCHDKVHAHVGPHLHHMNHVHLVTQESDANAVLQQCGHQLKDSLLSCHAAPCLSAKPVHAAVISALSDQRQTPSQLLATSIQSSVPIAQAHPPFGVCRIRISASPFASVSLRI